MNLFHVFFMPSKLYNNIKEKPDWVLPLIVISSILIIIQLLSFPIYDRILENSDILSQFSHEQVESMKQLSHKTRYISLFIQLFITVISWLFYSLIIYLGVMIFKTKQSYKKVFSLFIYSYTIIMLSELVNLGIIYSVGVEKIFERTDLLRLGVNIFFSADSIGVPLYTLLSYFNLFQIWFIIILIQGLSVIFDLSRVKSFFIIIFVWSLSVAIPVLNAFYSQMMMSRMTNL